MHIAYSRKVLHDRVIRNNEKKNVMELEDNRAESNSRPGSAGKQKQGFPPTVSHRAVSNCPRCLLIAL